VSARERPLRAGGGEVRNRVEGSAGAFNAKLAELAKVVVGLFAESVVRLRPTSARSDYLA
jgi:hypothetical protein